MAFFIYDICDIAKYSVCKIVSDTYDSGYWYYREFFSSYPHYLALMLVFVLTIIFAIFKIQLSLTDTFFVLSSIFLLFYVYKSGGDFMHWYIYYH